MKRFSAAALVAFVLIGPIGALAGAPPIPPPAPLSLPLSTAKGGTGNSTGAADSLTVGGTSLAQRFGHVFNLMDDGGALGDGQYSTVTATIGSGSTSLSVSSSTFSSSDVPAGCAPGTTSSCKTIGITGAGGAQTTGRITAIPVLTRGQYTSLPSVTISTPSGPITAATPGVIMGVTGATINAAGSGCPANSTVTATIALNVVNHSPLIIPTAQITIGAGGTATGVSSVTSGEWLNDFPSGSLSALATTGAGCSVSPTLNVTMGLIAVAFGNVPVSGFTGPFYGTGYGDGYPLSGVTASVSAGTVTATLGTPVVSAFVTPLVAKIVGYTSPTQITLDTTATTALSAASTPIIWGHIDTTAFSTAVASGLAVYIPPLSSGRCFIVDEVLIPSNTTIFGDGPASQLCAPAGSYNPAISASGSVSNVSLLNFKYNGNALTFPTTATANGLFSGPTGSTNLTFKQLTITNCGRHCLTADGGSGVVAEDNYINGSYFGAGIYIGNTNVVSNVLISRNITYNTQWAGATGLMNGAQIVDNQINGSNLGFGDSTHGNVQDCITGYSADTGSKWTLISGNVLSNCGNNGIHWGADYISITNNLINNAYLSCVLAARSPNSDPTSANSVQIIGNKCQGVNNLALSRSMGISVGNFAGGVISGNYTNNTYELIILNGWADMTGNSAFSVYGNTALTVQYCIWATQKLQYSEIYGNVCQGVNADGIRLDSLNNGAGTSPNFYNHIGTNSFYAVRGNAVVEVASSNFNIVEPQHVTGSTGGSITLVGSGSFANNVSSTSLTATGTNQAGALPLLYQYSTIGTCAPGAGAVLNPAGVHTAVTNQGANACLIYPPSGAQINSLGTNTAYSLGVGSTIDFVQFSATQWYTH